MKTSSVKRYRDSDGDDFLVGEFEEGVEAGKIAQGVVLVNNDTEELVGDNAPLPVTGPVTDAQIRASAVPVSGPITDAQIRASPLPVSGPLTDDQLRASDVKVTLDGEGLPLPNGAATEAKLDAILRGYRNETPAHDLRRNGRHCRRFGRDSKEDHPEGPDRRRRRENRRLLHRRDRWQDPLRHRKRRPRPNRRLEYPGICRDTRGEMAQRCTGV